jgi:hypothetical protein
MCWKHAFPALVAYIFPSKALVAQILANPGRHESTDGILTMSRVPVVKA